MTGLKLTFNGLLGWQFLPDEIVSGFDATVQCALVCLATEKGSNKQVPDFGTNLLAAGLYGLMTALGTTKHQANFAAAATQTVINNNTTDDSTIGNMYLQPETFNPPNVSFEAAFISSKQEQRGIILAAN